MNVEAEIRVLLTDREVLRDEIREGGAHEEWGVRNGGLGLKVWISMEGVLESESKEAVAVKRLKGERGGRCICVEGACGFGVTRVADSPLLGFWSFLEKNKETEETD